MASTNLRYQDSAPLDAEATQKVLFPISSSLVLASEVDKISTKSELYFAFKVSKKTTLLCRKGHHKAFLYAKATLWYMLLDKKTLFDLTPYLRQFPTPLVLLSKQEAQKLPACKERMQEKEIQGDRLPIYHD